MIIVAVALARGRALGDYLHNCLVDIRTTNRDCVLARLREENSMIFSNDRTTKDPLLNTLSEEHTAAWMREEQAAAWARFYAIEVDSSPGELEYDRALAAAKRLDTAVAKIVAAGGGRPEGDWPF
jgi:hypothetical protein